MAIAARGQLNFDEVPGGCRGFDSFEKLRLLGQGTYGEVSMAKEKRTKEVVAVKKLKLAKENYEKEGFPITAIREIKILNKLRHENVIKLKEIVTSPVQIPDAGDDIYMVFEYMDHDLTGLANRVSFSVPQIKCYMSQLLKGLHYCHANGVLHRDIKSSNLLINNEGSLKLGDFGLSRTTYSSEDYQNGRLTNQVVTLWYRPPELLLGATKYGPAIDMWSAGCIFAELLCQGRPIFNGRTEAEVITKIVEVCGAPDEANWPGVSELPLYDTFCKGRKTEQDPKRPLSEMFRHCDRHALELLEKLLTLDPSKRISAKDALDADYFWTDPLPCDPKSLPNYDSSHELSVNKRKQQPLPDVENAAKRQKPVQYQQQPSRLIPPPPPPPPPPPSHQPDEESAPRSQKPVRYEQQQHRTPPLGRQPDEENAPKGRKPVRYGQQYPRTPPRSYEPDEENAPQIFEKGLVRDRERPYRPSYPSKTPVAAWPRRHYERSSPRRFHGERRYHQSPYDRERRYYQSPSRYHRSPSRYHPSSFDEERRYHQSPSRYDHSSFDGERRYYQSPSRYHQSPFEGERRYHQSPYDGERRYYRNERYASGWDSKMRGRIRNRRY